MEKTSSGIGQVPANQRSVDLTNILGIGSTVTSLALLAATGFFLFKRERPPFWYLILAGGKIGLDLVQAAWVMSLVRQDQAAPIPSPAPTEGIM